MLVLKSHITLKKYLFYAKTIKIISGRWDWALIPYFEEIKEFNYNIDIEIIHNYRDSLLLVPGRKYRYFKHDYQWIDDNIMLLIDNHILILGLNIKSNNIFGETIETKYIIFEDNYSLATTFLSHFEKLKTYINADRSTEYIRKFLTDQYDLQQAIIRMDGALLGEMEKKFEHYRRNCPTLKPFLDTLFYHWKMRKYLDCIHILSNLNLKLNVLPLGPLKNLTLPGSFYLDKLTFANDFYKLMQEIQNQLNNRLNYFSAQNREKISPLLKKLLALKLEVIDYQLEKTTDAGVRKKLEQLKQSINNDLKLLNNEPAEYSRSRDLYLTIFNLSQDQKQRLQQVYKETVRLVHPDIVNPAHTKQAQQIVQILNEVYQHDDLDTITELNRIISDLKMNSSAKDYSYKFQIASTKTATIFYKNQVSLLLQAPVSTATSIKEAYHKMKQSIEEEIKAMELQKLLYEGLSGDLEMKLFNDPPD